MQNKYTIDPSTTNDITSKDKKRKTESKLPNPEGKLARTSQRETLAYAGPLPTAILRVLTPTSTDYRTLRLSSFSQTLRGLAYRCILQNNQEKYEEQLEALGLCINNAPNFLDIPEIEIILTTYQRRADIPAENRVLATACLAILFFLKKDENKYQDYIKELYTFSLFDQTLFQILCCYIFLYRSEYEQCREILAKLIKEEDLYDHRYAYFKPYERLGQILKVHNSPDADYYLACARYSNLTAKHVSDLAKMRLYPQVFLQLVGEVCICLREEKIIVGNIQSLMAFMKLITKETADKFIEACFALKYFEFPVHMNFLMDSKEVIHIAKLCSKENKHEIITKIKESLSTLFDDHQFIAIHKRCLYQGVNGEAELFEKILNYFQLIKAVDPTLFIELIASEINKANSPRVDIYIRQNKITIIAILTTYLESIPPDVAKFLEVNFSRGENSRGGSSLLRKIPHAQAIVSYTTKALEKDNRFIQRDPNYGRDPNVITQRQKHRQNLEMIKSELAQTFIQDCKNITVEHDDAYFEEESIECVELIEKLCQHDVLSITKEDQLVLFNCLFGLPNKLDDAELILRFLRCSFVTRDDFCRFLNDQLTEIALRQQTMKSTENIIFAVIALAPYLNHDMLEKFFEEASNLARKFLEKVEGDQVNQEDLLEFVPVKNFDDCGKFIELLNILVFYLTPEKRREFIESLSEGEYMFIFGKESESIRLCNHVIKLIADHKEVLAEFEDGFSNRLLAAFVQGMNSERNFDDVRRALSHKPELEAGSITDLFTKCNRENSELLNSVCSVMSDYYCTKGRSNEQERLNFYNALLSPISWTQKNGIAYHGSQICVVLLNKMLTASPRVNNRFAQFSFACITNNSVCLKQIISKLQDAKTSPDDILVFDLELRKHLTQSGEAQSQKLYGFELANNIRDIVVRFLPNFHDIVEKAVQQKSMINSEEIKSNLSFEAG